MLSGGLWAISSGQPCSHLFEGYIFVIPMPLVASDGLCCFALVPPVTSSALSWALLGAPGLSFALLGSLGLGGLGAPGLSWAFLGPSALYFKKMAKVLCFKCGVIFFQKMAKVCCFKLIIIISANMGLS